MVNSFIPCRYLAFLGVFIILLSPDLLFYSCLITIIIDKINEINQSSASKNHTFGLKNLTLFLHVTRCPVPCFNLQWGRTDAAECSTTEPALPSPTMTGDQMFDYYEAQFGFSRAQVRLCWICSNKFARVKPISTYPT